VGDVDVIDALVVLVFGADDADDDVFVFESVVGVVAVLVLDAVVAVSSLVVVVVVDVDADSVPVAALALLAHHTS
jgi:hypothetical protein